MATVTARALSRPARGTARWLVSPHYNGTPALQGTLAINGMAYAVGELLDDDQSRVGWELRKQADGETRAVYHVDTTTPFSACCDCADATFRDRPCKHVKALAAALAIIGRSIEGGAA